MVPWFLAEVDALMLSEPIWMGIKEADKVLGRKFQEFSLIGIEIAVIWVRLDKLVGNGFSVEFDSLIPTI